MTKLRDVIQALVAAHAAEIRLGKKYLIRDLQQNVKTLMDGGKVAGMVLKSTSYSVCRKYKAQKFFITHGYLIPVIDIKE